MTHYSENPNMCRVDFFKESGKWYATEAIDFASVGYALHPAVALEKALAKQLSGRFAGMWAVCLEPYVEHPFPVMTKVPEGFPTWPEPQ